MTSVMALLTSYDTTNNTDSWFWIEKKKSSAKL